MRLAEPAWLIFLILAPLPWLFQRARPRIAWPTLDGFPRRGASGLRRLGFLPVLLRGAAIAALVVALARPQTAGGGTPIAGPGVAVVGAAHHSPCRNARAFPPQNGAGARLGGANR